MKFLSIINQPEHYHSFVGSSTGKDLSLRSELENDDSLEDLSVLQLIGNNIKDISKFSILWKINLQDLTLINLSSNNMKSIPPLGHLKSLASIDVSYNKLESLDFLKNVSSLTTIRCHHNNIDSLGSLVTSDAKGLSELWLSFNKLEWVQFSHLKYFTSLRVVVKHNNPSDEKNKFNEFLLSILPSLVLIDHQLVRGGASSGTNRPITSSISLGQAHSIMDLPDDEEASINLENTRNPVCVDVKIMLTQAKAFMQKEKAQLSRTNSVEHLTRAKTASISRNASEKDLFDQSGDLSSFPSTLQIDENKSKNYNKSKVRSRLPSSNKAKESISISEDDIEVGATRDRAKCLYFKEKNSKKTVAIKISSNGDGFLRWSENGQTACSLEDNKLTANYLNGNAAVVYDIRSGNGFVSDPMGTTILNITTDECTANIASSQDSATTMHRGDTKLAQLPELSWAFNDLSIRFVPSEWNLIVGAQNSVGKCELSSVTGAELLQDSAVPSTTHAPHSPAKKSSSRGTKVSAVQEKGSEPTLASVNTGLDHILAHVRSLK